jgi:hypothetical protein
MYGVESEEIFREQVKDALEQRRDSEQRAAMREQVSEQLVAKIDFALPSKLSESQAARTIEQQRMELLSRGLDPASVETRLAELRGKSEKVAKDRLKLFFIMARLAQHFGVNITEQELNGRVAMMAAQQNMRPEQMRQQIEKSGRMNEVISMIRDDEIHEGDKSPWPEWYQKKWEESRVEMEKLRTSFAAPSAVDPEMAKKLASLGYISSGATAGDGPLDDPKDHIETVGLMKAALHEFNAGNPEITVAMTPPPMAPPSTETTDDNNNVRRVMSRPASPMGLLTSVTVPETSYRVADSSDNSPNRVKLSRT